MSSMNDNAASLQLVTTKQNCGFSDYDICKINMVVELVLWSIDNLAATDVKTAGRLRIMKLCHVI